MKRKNWICFAVVAMCAWGCSDLAMNIECGNGILEYGEQCDLGDQNGQNSGCTDACVVEAGWSCDGTGLKCEKNCGNGKLDFGEQCDLGADNGQDKGCTDSCFVELAWTCDETGLKCEKNCGNGKPDFGEQCDDGNNIDGDGCSSDCQYEYEKPKPECGNGFIEKDNGEQCDDGNLENGDGCSSDCQNEYEKPEPECGNGIKEDGEECDDGNNIGGDGCSSDCQNEYEKPEPECGNGIKEDGEECDDGNTNDGDGCSSDCKYEQWKPNPDCGNGNLDEGEECDPGIPAMKDGCTGICIPKDGYRCDDKKCTPIHRCNDGVLQLGLEFESTAKPGLMRVEQCDDGNAMPGDGCDPECQLEPFYELVLETDEQGHIKLKPKLMMQNGENNTNDETQFEQKLQCQDVLKDRTDVKNTDDVIPLKAVFRDFLRNNENLPKNYSHNEKSSHLYEKIKDNILCIKPDAPECISSNNDYSPCGNQQYGHNANIDCNFTPRYKFEENSPRHPDFGHCANISITKEMVGKKLGDNGKPVYDESSNGALCRESFDMWYDTNDYYNKAEVQYLLLRKINEKYVFGTSDIEISDESNTDIYREILLKNNSILEKQKVVNGQFHPLNGRGFHLDLKINEKDTQNDAFTAEISAYVRINNGKLQEGETTTEKEHEYTALCDDDCWVFINGWRIIDNGGSHNEMTENYKFSEHSRVITYTNSQNNSVNVRYYDDIQGYENTLYPMKVFYADRYYGSHFHLVIPDLVNPVTTCNEANGSSTESH